MAVLPDNRLDQSANSCKALRLTAFTAAFKTEKGSASYHAIYPTAPAAATVRNTMVRRHHQRTSHRIPSGDQGH